MPRRLIGTILTNVLVNFFSRMAGAPWQGLDKNPNET
jgi:hypothetical protein